jgi:hypothetical protein
VAGGRAQKQQEGQVTLVVVEEGVGGKHEPADEAAGHFGHADAMRR